MKHRGTRVMAPAPTMANVERPLALPPCCDNLSRLGAPKTGLWRIKQSVAAPHGHRSLRNIYRNQNPHMDSISHNRPSAATSLNPSEYCVVSP